MQNGEHLAAVLRQKGLRATPGRIALLSALSRMDRPQSITHILKKMHGDIDQATAYRALETLTNIGFVRRVDLGHGHADYEIAEDEKHHHHLICRSCGRLEDVEHCDVKDFERTVLSRSKQFALIKNHTLEFFGTCNKCVGAA